MYVTKDKNLTTEEIRKLSDDELREIYQARLEDWFIKPMEILDQHEHTGMAIAYLFKQFLILTPSALYAEFLLKSIDMLNSEPVFVDGDPEITFTQHFSSLVVNPHKVVEFARGMLKTNVKLLDTDSFRLVLIKKSKLMKG